MAKFQPWLKMWVEWIDDPKMLSLSLAEQGTWWRLLTLAKKCAADGLLVKGNGAPLPLDQVAAALRITNKADRKVFDSMVQKMIDQDSLHWNSNALVVTHFAERQAKIASETPEAVRDRVRRYRERKAGLPPDPPLYKEKDIYIDTEAEAEVEGNGVTPVTCNGKTVTAEAVLAEIVKYHEQNFSIITPILSEKFKDFVENYRGPIEWIKEAFTEAVTHNARKWAYVEAILDRWQLEGRKPYDKRQSQNGRPGANRGDTPQGDGLGGWGVIESGPDEEQSTDSG